MLKGPEVKIIDGDNIYVLNSNKNNIKITLNNNITKFIGNNSLVNVFFPLTDDSDENIKKCQNKDECEFLNLKEFFIIPSYKDFNRINLKIIVDDDSFAEINTKYLSDFNEIPYSRNKQNILKKIILKNKKEYSILVKNIIQNDIIQHSNEEQFYIYFSLSEIVKKINVKIEFFNEIYPDNSDIIILNKGINKIYLGDSDKNYIQIDQCKNLNKSIKYSIIRDEKINSSEKEMIIDEWEKIINCYKNNEDNSLYLEINSNEELLFSNSNSEIELLDQFIFNYDLDIDLDESNLIVNFSSVSLFPQAGYSIIITNGKYLNDLLNHCFIHRILEKKDYILKDNVFSNGEEDLFSKKINITKMKKLDDNSYVVVIISKEKHKNYIVYRYYNPKSFNLKIESSTKENGENKKKKRNIIIHNEFHKWNLKIKVDYINRICFHFSL